MSRRSGAALRNARQAHAHRVSLAEGSLPRGLDALMHGEQLPATPAVTVGANATDDPGPPLIRGLGRWDLLALVINGVVDAGIFGLPAKVQSLLGVFGLWAIVLCAAMIVLVVLCFAELASRYDQTGGPYVYAGAAFGPVMGAATGWVLWLARVTGCCAICSLLLDYLGYFDSQRDDTHGRLFGRRSIRFDLIVVANRSAAAGHR